MSLCSCTLCVCVCVCACVRACVRACVFVCVCCSSFFKGVMEVDRSFSASFMKGEEGSGG